MFEYYFERALQMLTFKASVGGLGTATVNVFQILRCDTLSFLFLFTSPLLQHAVKRCNVTEDRWGDQMLKIGRPHSPVVFPRVRHFCGMIWNKKNIYGKTSVN